MYELSTYVLEIKLLLVVVVDVLMTIKYEQVQIYIVLKLCNCTRFSELGGFGGL